MEPVGIFLGIWFLIGGYELWVKEEPKEVIVEVVQKEPLVSDKPIYERGRYYRMEGYYISDLSTASEPVEGCDRSVLTTDLIEPRDGNSEIRVTKVDISCEG